MRRVVYSLSAECLDLARSFCPELMDTNTIYDEIGVDYIATRRPDPRIAAYLAPHVAGLTRLLNVGAGSGSYEPMDREVVAIEPSWRMIKQRTADSSPSVQGKSESLPFRRDSFDGSLALLTLHHWNSIAEGLQEMKRVSCKGCVSKVVEISFGASPSGLSFAAVRPRGQGFRRRLADRGFPIHRLCASGFGRKRGAPREASALFRDTAARSVF